MREARIEITLDGEAYRAIVCAPSPLTGKLVRVGLPITQPGDHASALASAGRYARATGLPVVDTSRGVVVDFWPCMGTGAGRFAQDMTELEIFRMTHDDKPPLDRWRFDQILEPERKLWGLPQIAEVLGVSVGTARKLAARPEVPIYRPEGSDSYFAWLSELRTWQRGKKMPPCV